MKYCVKCGEELKDGNICNRCGFENNIEFDKEKILVISSLIFSSIAVLCPIILMDIPLIIFSIICSSKFKKGRFKYFAIISFWLCICSSILNLIYFVVCVA